MSITKAIGTTVTIASTYGTLSVMSAVTNANPAVATFGAAHGFVVGDKIHILSAWPGLNNRYVRVSAVATNDVTLEGVNTVSTTDYPAGGGAGSAREVTASTEISQIGRAINVSGGEQQYADTSLLKFAQDTRIPINRSAIDVTLPLYDDPSAAFVAVVTAADGIETAGEFTYKNGSRLMFTAFWSLGQVATIEDFTLRNALALAFANTPIKYAT